MNLAHTSNDFPSFEADLAIAGVFANEPLPSYAEGLLEAADFKADFKQTLLLYTRAGARQLHGGTRGESASARRLLLVGLGKKDELSAERIRQAFAAAAQAAHDLAIDSIVAKVPDAGNIPGPEAARALAEGILLALYRFDQFKGSASKQDREPAREIDQLTVAGGGDGAAEEVALAETLYRGVKLARDLGNEPPMVCTPSRLAEVAREVAERGGFQLTILDRPQMEELGMGGLLGVARGTEEPPKFIVLEHGKQGDGKTLAFVGKGITFDTGGISIKPADKMDLMKMDMMGAGAVLGAMSVLADLKPKNVHVVGIVGATENKPSGTAFVPGDILKALNGVTMEIVNTDAEGRLVLADGLSYAQRFEPDGIVDLATLTGACVVALGNQITGLMTNNAQLADRVKAAAAKTGEMVWELPLIPEYREAVKSKVADIRNSAGRPAGAITAAAFLENFVDGRPWVHLDIAGTMVADDRPKPYAQQGATGVGVRLLVELVRSYAEG